MLCYNKLINWTTVDDFRKCIEDVVIHRDPLTIGHSRRNMHSSCI